MSIYSKLFCEGLLQSTVVKTTTDSNTGVVSTYLVHNFVSLNQKGLELIKVKDIDSIYKNLEINKIAKLPIRVTMSDKGTTFYEIATFPVA